MPNYLLSAQLLLSVARATDGMTCSQLCRTINKKPERGCYDCKDYGNKWKRKRGILKTPSCKVRKCRVWYALQQLLKLRVLWSQMEKRPDRFMTRGWDRMRVYRLN